MAKNRGGGEIKTHTERERIIERVRMGERERKESRKVEGGKEQKREDERRRVGWVACDQ